MKKHVFTVILILLCLFSVLVLAEPRAYTYGGSGDDNATDLAVSADGRIVLAGYTNSADGTLATRTKTGRSGWALCVDAQGNVLWSFCTRLGNHDTLRLPVFHEDGSVTLMLEAEWLEAGKQELELIRLDARGELLSRRTLLLADNDESYVFVSRATDEGYILNRISRDLQKTEYTLFDWDGERLRELDAKRESGVHVRAQDHLVRVEGDTGTLMGVDEAGNETPLAHVFDVEKDRRLSARIWSLISLADGGAIGAGVAGRDGEYKGRLVRWDAQGNLVFDWQMVGETELDALACTANGFAAVGYVEGTETASIAEWTLTFFDEAGIRVKSIPLGDAMWGDNKIAQLPDGSLVIVQRVDNEGSSSNTRVTVVPIEDIP